MPKNCKEKFLHLRSVFFENTCDDGGMTLIFYSEIMKRGVYANEFEKVVSDIYSYLLGPFSKSYNVSIPQPVWGSKVTKEGDSDYFGFTAKEEGSFEELNGDFRDYDIERFNSTVVLIDDYLSVDTHFRLPLDRTQSFEDVPCLTDNFDEQASVIEGYHKDLLGIDVTKVDFYNIRKDKALIRLIVGEERSERIFSGVKKELDSPKKVAKPKWFKGVLEAR